MCMYVCLCVHTHIYTHTHTYTDTHTHTHTHTHIGTMGIIRNLSAEEILASVVIGRREASARHMPSVDNIVFMAKKKTEKSHLQWPSIANVPGNVLGRRRFKQKKIQTKENSNKNKTFPQGMGKPLDNARELL